MIAEVEQRTPDLPVLVIAGNFQQARLWARREKLPASRWKYIANRRAMDGARNRRVVWVGTFFERRDFEEICRAVDRLVMMGLVCVDRNEIVNHGRQARKKTDS